MNIIALHEQTREYAYPLDRNTLILRCRVQRSSCSKCSVVFWNRCLNDEKERTCLRCYARDDMFDYFEAELLFASAARYILYYFELEIDGHALWLNYHGIQSSSPLNGFYEYSYTNDGDIFRIPNWANGCVFYQIFPERFANGDLANDPEGLKAWNGTPQRDSFMGGDLAGITNKLPYLNDLGIEALYLNPVFKAPSNHKYDTVDYFTVDPAFGDIDILRQLVSKCHDIGIRVILDGVFNHCGYRSPMFEDVRTNGIDSPFSDWFYIESFPLNEEKLNYETIGYFNQMPKLRLSNPKVRGYLINVGKFWVEVCDIDGWRLDVAEEVEYTFLQEFRKEIKAIKSECFLLGETWRENRDMVRGDQMDSIMNYVFRNAVIEYFAYGSIDSMNFDRRIGRMLGIYSSVTLNSMFNIVGSHDTIRLLTACKGDKSKMKAIIAFQLTFPGIPVIYYGDEVGMDGETDPDCRKAMVWEEDRQDVELLGWCRKLISLRKTSNALRYGTCITNYCSVDDKVFGFIREYQKERVYVVINNSDLQLKVTIPLLEDADGNNGFVDVLDLTKYNSLKIDGSSFYNSDILKYNSRLDISMKSYQVRIFLKIN